MKWLARLFHRRRLEDQLDSELRFDFEQRLAARLRSGMSDTESRRAVRLEFGGLEKVKEECRDARGLQALDSLLQDVRYAFRSLRRSPGFTIVAVTILALGIGINAAVFTIAKAALFAGFPLVEKNDRLLYVTESHGCCVSYADFEDWRAQAKSFEGMALVHGAGRLLTDPHGFAENHDVTEITAATFGLVGQRPMIGRDFAEADEMPGAPPVLILSYGMWERRFGKDQSIVGRTVRLESVPTTVIGIMPPGFSFPQKQDLWVPLVPTPEVRKRDNRGTWFVFARMASGVTVQRARAEMETIGRRLESAYPLTNRGVVPLVHSFNEFFFFDNESSIYWLMWGAVAFVLLIACANLANLMLARAIGRTREISVRIALGAGRWRVVRHLLAESLILSVAGAALGWWLAKWSVRAWELADRGPGTSSWRILDYTPDYRVLAYLITISIGTAIFFGLVPARRLSKVDVNATLKEGGRGATGGWAGTQLSALLVTVEVALAIVLLAGAGVMIRSFLNIYHADLGVRTANILTASVRLPAAAYPRPEDWVSFFGHLKTRLEAIPGVESVTMSDSRPAVGTAHLPFALAATPLNSLQPKLAVLIIGPDYFRTLGDSPLSGRAFDKTDAASGLPVAVVNERFAGRYLPGENPLGKRVRLFDFYGNKPGAWLTIVGVVPNIAQNGAARQEFDPQIYLPYAQKPARSMELLARTRVPPGTLAIAFRREIRALDADLPVSGPVTLEERLQGNYWTSGLYAVLFLIFAGIALLLAAVGLYAVIAHSVTRRTQEIGIRIAIGATARDVRDLVFKQGMIPMTIGLAIGLIAALVVNRALKSFLVHVSPSDPVSLAAASVTLILAAVLGCWIPARRATRVDPAVALRNE